MSQTKGRLSEVSAVQKKEEEKGRPVLNASVCAFVCGASIEMWKGNPVTSHN